MGQLQLCNVANPHCLFRHRLEEHDNHCFEMRMGRDGYEVIAEDSPNIDMWLASTRGIGLLDVVAKDVSIPRLPNFIPTVRRGSGKLFTQYRPEYVGVLLRDVVSPVKLEVAKNLNERTGAPIGTKFVLLGYGSDQLIENLWPHKKAILEQLAVLDWAAVTSVNYSIWDDQPHAERLINIKRGLLTYEDWQDIGVPAIPHIYWYGRKDLDAWVEWLHKNPLIATVAINLQTLAAQDSWSKAMDDLTYFVSKLDRDIHFLITGPQKLARIEQLADIVPTMTLSNGYALRMAANGQLIKTDGVDTFAGYSTADRSGISVSNTSIYERYVAQTTQRSRSRMLTVRQPVGIS